MTVTLLTHPDCEDHYLPRHPERPERLLAVMERFNASGLADEVTRVQALEASQEELQLIHPADYVAHIEAQTPAEGQAVKVDPDTYMSSGSAKAARLAAGAAVQAARLVVQGEARRAFCAVRPPGHHAEVAAAMGFCLFNNVALAAQVALQSPAIERVAILDFDVHHCNGTVDIFQSRPEVLVCSSFQENFYPHRYLDFENEHIVNTPLAAGTRSKDFRLAIERSWLPAIQRHRPDFILISAGFDAHKDDPLAQLSLTTDDYRWITSLILDLAAEHAAGRLLSTLEGGYDLRALADSAEVHLAALHSQ